MRWKRNTRVRRGKLYTVLAGIALSEFCFGSGSSQTSVITLQGKLNNSVGGFFLSGPYSTYHGFWTPSLVPTAANALVSGRARTSGGQGIGNSRVVLIRAMTGETQVSLTNQFGYFRFEGVPVGESCFLSVVHKHYEFESRFISVVDDVSDLEFVAINLEI